ncbi:putative phosphatidate phosphatase isoform X2 [Dreissena polymorpha]|uniref:Phosphatidic acid phosphatase type 2/haloperoxidase domain-containing protein n=1 Tax=Dreissena polymorpha TaxID=45954 RepID=A0A9D4S1T9_DREPO|nr:putative phosphatidate phosphatase isoform X1 [Dreissena polymorpha]XP_052236196.1 putative phosphatidate phosphatase isoform X2 [Dreissena polymorpha]KAH3888811.1 hypothetical protein DPMN_012849 [Dreissena polymorpha]
MINEELKNVLKIFVSDAVIIGAGGIILLLFRVLGDPYKRGFFCDDDSLKYPFHDSTVTSAMLYGIGFVLAVIVMVVVESVLIYKCVNSQLKTDLKTYGHLKIIVRNIYISLVPFLFGAVIEHIVTDIGKYSIGRLRPHFFDVCKVNFSKINCSQGHIEDFECLGKEANEIREMRLSFPSGHASFSTYVAVYLVIYIQKHVTFFRRYLFRSVVQALLIYLAWYTCLSRITDYKHHPSDVIAGAVIGSTTAALVAYCVSDMFPCMSSHDLNQSTVSDGSVEQQCHNEAQQLHDL